MRFSAAFILFIAGFHIPPWLNAQDAQTSASPAPGTQVEASFQTADSGAVDYLIYLPENYQTQEKVPLMLFLHGRGESFGPPALVAKWGPPRFAARGDRLPYLVVSPQCPKSDNWSSTVQQQRLVALLDEITQKYKVDTDRIYLTGLSMGGFGSFRLAASHPERFAAVVPICGGAKPELAENLKSVPIWAFHGTEDRAVPLKRTADIVAAIKDSGGTSIQFTTLEGVGHNSWSAAYATPDLYIWMDKQTLKKADD